MGTVALGFPTKDFFVDMLTRDISLSDSILDLLDNCLDGVVRQKSITFKDETSKYYEGYYSRISFDDSSFSIEDNCGGIPRNVAEKYAFRMGRSSENYENDLPTVGIYGIGMKRAIFKIGRSAEVITRNEGELYRVTVPLDWVNSPEWDFPIDEPEMNDILCQGGTKIKICNINSDIVNLWNTKDKVENYQEELIKAIQQSYSFIIEKGFRIMVNEKEVSALPINVLVDNKSSDSKSRIMPYIYKNTFGDVKVSLAVGFYASPPSPEEIDDENSSKRSTAGAGWTIVCNDRVVLYNDKSYLTGWGESGVPQYHTQFIGIRGVVIFESNNPKALPMTTTKRGIDTSSRVYSAVKDRMKHGLKIFTDYTNKWKGQNEKEREYSTVAESVPVQKILNDLNTAEQSGKIKLRQTQQGAIFTPSLPKPVIDKPYRVVRFNKDIESISLLKEYFYGDEANPASPSQVGEKAFDEMILIAKETKDKDDNSAVLSS